MTNYPYKTFARKETHPARIGALARLYGIAAPTADSCSVFEIGCGDGGNIIPLAAQYPESSFVGIDLAGELIEQGRKEIASLNLSNIELIHGDIAEYKPATGSHDYVICHGVYSWVSPEAQRAIFDRAVAALSSQGVLFVSYNTLPGWRQRGALRDILQVGASFVENEDEGTRLENAMAFLALIVEQSSSITPYIREAAERLQSSEPSYIVQEFLGEYNSAATFTEFMRSASAAGLQFVSEARVVMMSSEDLTPELNEVLTALGDNIIAREQVIDIVRNRMFRETLLCHGSIQLDRGLQSAVFKDLIFVSSYIPKERSQASAIDTGATVQLIERYSGREVSAPIGECSAVLSLIAEIGPKGATFSQLVQGAAERASLDEQECLRVVYTLWKTGFIEALTASVCGTYDGVVVSPWARKQAVANVRVTSALHESYNLDTEERSVLAQSLVPMSFTALETLLLASFPRQRVTQLIAGLREKGFFL
ncbi:MAG: methyltransferase regulatory domain-containing protein [Pseudomonadota bacterium]